MAASWSLRECRAPGEGQGQVSMVSSRNLAEASVGEDRKGRKEGGGGDGGG